MKVVVIEYNAGNVKSVLFALKRIGVEAELTADLKKIRSADKVIFPGVGEAGSTMRFLRAKSLNTLIPELKQPFLGICLGLQLLCKYSAENDTECMGIFSPAVFKFTNTNDEKIKIPHIGWNNISNLKGKLFAGIEENSQVYFVHSYYADICPETAATCQYGVKFSASLERDNFYAVQFHPEKSAVVGERILHNFITAC